MLTADLPAKAMVLNAKQFNSRYGCSYCESEGATPPSDHLHRYWPYDPSAVLRSHASVVSNTKDAVKDREVVSCVISHKYHEAEKIANCST